MRQRRDKTGLPPEYRLIPKRADGSPIFLILPPRMQASYDRKMRRCEEGWRATGDPRAISEAYWLTFCYRQVPSYWLGEAVEALVEERRGKGHARRAHERFIRLMRYEAVRDARAVRTAKGKLTPWEEAYAQAAAMLVDTPEAAAEPETVRKAYDTVIRDLKAGRGGLYFTPKSAALRRRRRATPPNLPLADVKKYGIPRGLLPCRRAYREPSQCALAHGFSI
jgi:hypothetical protein